MNIKAIQEHLVPGLRSIFREDKEKTCGKSCRRWIRNCSNHDIGWCSGEMPRDYLHREESNMISYYADYTTVCPSFDEVGDNKLNPGGTNV